MRAVRILLNESLLLAGEESGSPCLRFGCETLLRRLCYSNLYVGLCYQDVSYTRKVDFLKKMSALYSFDCISLDKSSGNESLDVLVAKWDRDGDIWFYVSYKLDESLFSNLMSNKCKIICVGTGNDYTLDKEVLVIDKLEELLITICRFIKKEMCDKSILTVGYIMKPSREEDFAKRGAFPLYPTNNGLTFLPLSFELSLSSQLQEVDVVLHKVTDEIVSIELNHSSFDFAKGISLSKGMCELERFVENNPNYCIIDPFNNIFPLMDRFQIQQILLGLKEVEGRFKLRAPHFLKVDNFNKPDLGKQLEEANLSFPVLVKPQAACGVSDAHNMALVFKAEDFSNLCVPLPAVIQEYVDHGSTIYKVYVLGNKIFHAVRKSMPNSSSLLGLSEKSGFSPISFNSLKNLPVASENPLLKDCLIANKELLDIDLVKEAGDWLRKQLDLTIFGFDVVIQENTGDHVVVDLNYLPSFKEVPDSDAIPSFWDAIKFSYEARMLRRGPYTS